VQVKKMTRLHPIRTLLLATLFVAIPAASFAGVFVSITVAPPSLPVYVQPVCPGDGFIWTPGFWAYGPDGYYWVPGTWVLAPTVGYLWTPGYWGFGGGFYAWHAGYWGPHIGFYGGVNYGFGYTGVGFFGGMWVGGRFSYNTAVTNVNTTIVHNTYVNNTVINNTTVNRTSFNGPGGINARPTVTETAASREQHIAPTAAQTSHEHAASMDRTQLASVNHGRPANAAVNRPLTSSTAMNHSNAPVAKRSAEPFHPNNARPPQGKPPVNHATERPVHGGGEHGRRI
jgi:hypothetical protein